MWVVGCKCYVTGITNVCIFIGVTGHCCTVHITHLTYLKISVACQNCTPTNNWDMEVGIVGGCSVGA